MKQFEKITKYPPELRARLNSFIVTEFDDSMTVEMQLRVLIKWIQKNIELTNEMVEYLNQFIEEFDSKLYDTVEKILLKWLDDGVFDDIISELIVKLGDLSIFRDFDKTVMEKIKNEFSEHWFNIKWFGAVGDGVHNDAPAIRLAIKMAEVNGGTVYFPEPEVAWTVKCVETNGYGFIIKKKNIILQGFSGKYYSKGIKVDVDCDMKALFLLRGDEEKENLDGIEVYNLYINLNKQCGSGFRTRRGYLSNSTFKNVQVTYPLENGFQLSTYMTTFENVFVNWSERDGFDIQPPELDGKPDINGVATSLTFTSCYANTGKGIGFKGLILTYCSFISCGVDHYPIGYSFTNPYSVTFVGCGAENCTQVMLLNGYLGVTISGLYGLYNGGDSEKSLIELGGGNSITISGLTQRLNKAIKKTITLKTSTFGTENITILDNSITENDVESLATVWKYRNPFKFIRGNNEEDFFNREITVKAENFYDEIRKFNGKVLNNDITIIVEDGSQPFQEYGTTVGNIQGNGSITIKSKSKDPNKVKLAQYLNFINTKVPIIIKDVTLIAGRSSTFNELSRFDNCPNVRLDNVIFDADNKNQGSMVSSVNNSRVSLSPTVINKGDYFTSKDLKILNEESGGRIEYDKMNTPPQSKYFNYGFKIWFIDDEQYLGQIFVKDVESGSKWVKFGKIE